MTETLVTVKIPSGNVCRDERRCIFAKYSKSHGAYNCALYGQFLRGGQEPQKCADCVAYTMECAGERECGEDDIE